MKVSVVIITYNEEKNISNCLKSVLKSSFKDMEIIVSDGGSLDETKSIVTGNFSQVKFMRSPLKGMAHQRNYGCKQSAGNYILSLDADMIISPQLIQECVDICESNGNVTGVYVPEIIMGNSFFNKVRRFKRSFYNGTVIDAIRFFRKEKAEKIGYYDEKLREACEDWDFDKRMKKEGINKLSKNVLYHNENNLTLKKYLKKKKSYSETLSDYINKWGKNDPDVKRQFGAYYRLWGVFVENGKWKKLIFHPVLFLGGITIRMIVGARYLSILYNIGKHIKK